FKVDFFFGREDLLLKRWTVDVINSGETKYITDTVMFNWGQIHEWNPMIFRINLNDTDLSNNEFRTECFIFR
ncbi:MAG: hypothetical protein N2738_08890, partial [Thermodesulfovibrionales bacterium]|nr:hypothetical protein [Thermodesulfovibrionales bacterium]